MVSALLALVLAGTQVQDTTTYKDAQTARLIERARARHRIQDTLVHDYQALVRTRVDAGFGRSRFAHILPIVAMETAAKVTWAKPNDLRVQVVGARTASVFRGAKIDGTFSEPWFVPRGLGDSIRFVDQEIPETPALHPLAPSGPDFYRYAIFDSVSMDLPGRRISAIGIRIEPKRMGPALIAGNLWVDVETAEVVRMTFTYLGDFLWSTPDSSTAADSAQARKDNRFANRILNVDAELEYALHESRYWMPYRQLVTLTVDIPWFISGTVPVRFVTTFADYQINQGVTPHFTVTPADSAGRTRCRRRGADSLCVNRGRDSDREREKRAAVGYTRAARWEGGRWELEMPPRDSLGIYEWPDRLALEPDAATDQLIRETTATLANLEHTLPADWVGRQAAGLAFERFSDLFRFNRVQGASVGAGARIASSGFSSLLGSARFGFSDRRPTGSLTFRREAPGGRFDLSAWRSVLEVEPWTRGSSTGNSMNVAFAGHDDADYYLALGGGISFLGNTGLARDAELGLRFERARSLGSRARAALNDLLGGTGILPANPAVLEGDYVVAAVSRQSTWGPLTVRYGVDGTGGVGGAGARTGSGRAWTSARARFDLLGRGGSVTVRGGSSLGDTLPQRLFRVGGPETVRGFDYGTRSGRHFWSSQMDLALTRSNVVSPVIFADAGDTSFSGKPLVSFGGGVSILGGLVRFNVAKGVSPRKDVRFDLLFRTAR